MFGIDLLLGAWVLSGIGLSGLGCAAMAKGAYDLVVGEPNKPDKK